MDGIKFGSKSNKFESINKNSYFSDPNPVSKKKKYFLPFQNFHTSVVFLKRKKNGSVDIHLKRIWIKINGFSNSKFRADLDFHGSGPNSIN